MLYVWNIDQHLTEQKHPVMGENIPSPWGIWERGYLISKPSLCSAVPSGSPGWEHKQRFKDEATKNGIELAKTPENENKKNPNENQTS